MAIVTTDNQHYADIAAALREHVGGQFRPREMATGVQDVYDAGWGNGHAQGTDEGFAVGKDIGKQEGKEHFWDTYLAKIKNSSSTMAFAGFGWTDELYQPTDTIVCGWSSNNMYSNSNLTDAKVPLDISAITTNDVHMFAGSKIRTAHLIVSENTRMHQLFTDATNLVNLTVEGTIGKRVDTQWCPLNRASIENVVRALSTATSGLTATFNKAAKEAAFDEDEWAALIEARDNWSFVLA